MARTLEARARFSIKEDSTPKDTHEAVSQISSLSYLYHSVLTLNTNTQNYQVNFGSGFTTPTHMILREQGGRTFSYSVGATTHHHPIAANGFIAQNGPVSSLYLSVSSSPTTRPVVEIILAR